MEVRVRSGVGRTGGGALAKMGKGRGQKRDSPEIKRTSAPGLQVPKEMRVGRSRTKSVRAGENSAEIDRGAP